jgi:hypothetical protein
VQACYQHVHWLLAGVGLASAGGEAVICPTPEALVRMPYAEWFLLTSRTEVTGRMPIFS